MHTCAADTAIRKANSILCFRIISEIMGSYLFNVGKAMGKREAGKGLGGLVGAVISWKAVMEDAIGKKACGKDLREFRSTLHRS